MVSYVTIMRFYDKVFKFLKLLGVSGCCQHDQEKFRYKFFIIVAATILHTIEISWIIFSGLSAI